MPDLQQLAIKKEKILNHIKDRGPSLPVHLAKALGVEPIFASAFLAELVNDQQLKTSNLRVGSSPLYHLSDQTAQLENFAQHLNRKEREAFQLLKSSQVLEDTNQEPAIRVALRSIKDFAIPLRARIDNQETLFWRYFLTPEEKAKTIIKNGIPKEEQSPEPKPAISQESTPTVIPQKAPAPTPAPPEQPTPAPFPQPTSPEPAPTPQPKKSEPAQPQTSEPAVKPLDINSAAQAAQPTTEPEAQEIPQIHTHQATIQETPPQQPKPKPIKKQPDLTFTTNAQAHLQTKQIHVQEWLDRKKKEGEAIVKIPTQLGEQTLYIHMKEKKTVSEVDLTLAFQKAQTLRMPALFAAPGKLTKKAQAHLLEWQHLIKFEQLKP
jgi:hypothetical protein